MGQPSPANLYPPFFIGEDASVIVRSAVAVSNLATQKGHSRGSEPFFLSEMAVGEGAAHWAEARDTAKHLTGHRTSQSIQPWLDENSAQGPTGGAP